MDDRSQSQSGRPLRCAVHPPIRSSAPQMANQSDDKDINFEIFEIGTAAVVADEDADDIYIMMQCLCVTKNEHFPLSS